jgi:hypothetical protein
VRSAPKITKLPPGEALGARDLQRWSSRRRAGLSGAGSHGDEQDRLWRRGQSVITCAACSHSAAIPQCAADLAGKTLVCSRCGTRQRIALGQIIEAVYREDATKQQNGGQT